MIQTPLKPLNPRLHAAYTDVLTWWAARGDDPLPAFIRVRVTALLEASNAAPEEQLDAIYRELVAFLYWHVLRPDEIAERTIEHHGFEEPLTIYQATVVLAAIGEAGFPIAGNGAPDYDRRDNWWDALDPVRGEERDRVLWAAARHWATMASRHITYVSLGDCRGYCPRAVQYDTPGSMHPSQQASLTLGPACDADDECDSHGYMRGHTRRLVLVRDNAIVGASRFDWGTGR